MEKLIRYLLESKWEEYKGEYYEWYRDVELEQNIDSLSELKPFIKWLVENDKIDREQFYDKARKIITDFDLRWEYEWACNEIIMLLSISDTPIEDLILYLK
jgi:hypothetical protein